MLSKKSILASRTNCTIIANEFTQLCVFCGLPQNVYTGKLTTCLIATLVSMNTLHNKNKSAFS